MAKRPLLILPTPEPIAPPKGGGGGGNLRLPSRERQVSTFGPVFNRLRQAVLGELRDDPSSLSPDRVIVFEIGGTITDFFKAVARVDGLEFMAEYEADFPPDENFAIKDTRKGKIGEDRTDKTVKGRFYLAMPDVQAFRELLSLWDRWEKGLPFATGFAPFKHLFAQLHALRPWGPLDRIPEETVRFWQEERARTPDRPVRTEVELWFRQSPDRRKRVTQDFTALVTTTGGTVIHEVIIPEIAYHGALIDIPAGEIPGLIERRGVHLVLADDVMFLRPQSLFISPGEAEPIEDASIEERSGRPSVGQPIAALLDGVPIQAHALLANRLVLDDPDDLQSRALVSRRLHGTAMASLILHGDLNDKESPIDRPLYVRPLMSTLQDQGEQTDNNRLLIDTIYRAVLRIKGSADREEAVAPTVFLVNLSMGDIRRPFTRIMSPLSRLLDFLSEQYGILFLVSAGNVSTPLTIPDFATWMAFESASPDLREKAVLAALNSSKHKRSILSPAESLNALTIGAQHNDSVFPRPMAVHAVDPFDDHLLPNVSSGLGLGHRRAVKPEIYFPGGREYVRMKQSGDILVVSIGSPQRLYGLSAAAPDPTGQGRPGYVALSDGTSSATALATRAAHQIFDALMESGSMLADMDPQFYAVVVKSLLVHRARWNDKADLLKDICGPEDKRQSVERSENASRFIGFGVPDVKSAMECAANRATMVGYGMLPPNNAHSYRIPLPDCLERVTDPRSLTVTIAWFSPIKPGHQRYRCVRLEAAPLSAPVVVLGVDRLNQQPADAMVKRGTIFHEHFHGAKAVPFIDDGHLGLRVWCKEDAGGIEDSIRYGIAITIESETAIPIYDEIKQRLRVAPRPRR